MKGECIMCGTKFPEGTKRSRLYCDKCREVRAKLHVRKAIKTQREIRKATGHTLYRDTNCIMCGKLMKNAFCSKRYCESCARKKSCDAIIDSQRQVNDNWKTLSKDKQLDRMNKLAMEILKSDKEFESYKIRKNKQKEKSIAELSKKPKKIKLEKIQWE